jgi:membrane-bound metal-dependent hydrolase YbcI (DUF457 family)
MLFFGHIAVSVALADATDSDPAAAVAGNLLPDVVDKSLRFVARLTASRWLAHGLPSLTIACALTRPLLPERTWRGFALGYASHLAADLWAGGKVPWLAPFLGDGRPRFDPYTTNWFLKNLGPEVAGLVFLYLRNRDQLPLRSMSRSSRIWARRSTAETVS